MNAYCDIDQFGCHCTLFFTVIFSPAVRSAWVFGQMMAIMESNGEQDNMAQFISYLTQVSDQLTKNRTLAVSLHTLTTGVKVRWHAAYLGYWLS